MIKTKIQGALWVKKALAIIALWAIATTNVASVFAVNIGTGSVSGTTAFDSTVIWDGNFPWTATGTVSGIVVSATIAPTLNMAISTWAINLWTLTSAAYSTGSLNIEIGTNAVNGVNVTAKSSSGWLTNTSDNAIKINNTNADGAVDSYKFTSSTWAVADSTSVGYIQSSALNTEVFNNTTAHTIYTTNKPEQTLGLNDITFSVSAKPNAQTPAWNYQDKITFTVVGNF